ncbi:uncharacterized protein LOC111240709 [Vigna radiata var. radiata]|uniref:Uncharacterized protein LOC111240709 n=1 Tax=Vigna radiata var. radiata TaxID=3916 RepID=A0A3Q0ELM6_VIGRR|nr:uncharacterized protein LOC111240709 [Vigna radiata var. radiata]
MAIIIIILIVVVFLMGFFSICIRHYNLLPLRKHPQPHRSHLALAPWPRPGGHRHFPHSRVLRGEDPQAWKGDVFAECIYEVRTTVMTKSATAVEVMRFMVAAERGDDACNFVDRRRWRKNTVSNVLMEIRARDFVD